MIEQVKWVTLQLMMYAATDVFDNVATTDYSNLCLFIENTSIIPSNLGKLSS